MRLFKLVISDFKEMKWTKKANVVKQSIFTFLMIIASGTVFLGIDLIVQKIISMIV